MRDNLRRELKGSGHNMTTSRVLVCQKLADTGPVTMRELVESLGKEVDRATVYRIISLFEELGIVRRIPIGWKHKLELSDKFIHHHHHAHCLTCRNIITLPEDSQLELAVERTASSHHFKVTDHHIELHGYCSECQKKLS